MEKLFVFCCLCLNN